MVSEAFMVAFWALNIKWLILESDVCPCCLTMRDKIDFINSYPEFYNSESLISKKYWMKKDLIWQYRTGGLYCS